jgi:hypothetical protein
MRKALLISFLCFFLTSKSQFTFTRGDSIVIKQGTDTLKFAWAGGMNFCQFNSIDINLDGLKDLFVFDRTNNQPLTFINQGGTGQINYKYEPSYESKFPALLNWALLRDYNCDGKEDIWCYSPGGFAIYKNISDTVLKFQKIVNLLKGTQCTSFLNIYVSSVDLPSVEDMDYDGDLDILTWGIFGTFVEYHKNYSVELGFGCDSLKFILKNQSWGHFMEDVDSCQIYLDTAQANCAGVGIAESGLYNETPITYEGLIIDENETPVNYEGMDIDGNGTQTREGETRHAGSTILAIDMNGINSKDIIEADISCNSVSMLINGGTAPNMNSDMISADITFPSYDVPVNISTFPGIFYVDINNDGKRDLICAPNSYTNSDNTTGNWLYLNTTTDTTPVFDFIQNAFLQDEMVERGEGSLPVFFDYDNDGLKDLVVANFGFYTTGGTYTPKLGLYKNVGTANNPTYDLVNNDYGNLFAALGVTGLYPTFGDLDNDGDKDMIVGDKDGHIHYFTNTAGTTAPAAFTLTTPLMTDNTATTIDVGQYATPLLVDLNRDGDLDLVIGRQLATLWYYENTGTVTAPVFTLIEDTLGGIDVSENWTPVGYSVPAIYDNAGNYVLFVGSQKGVLYQYDNIDGNLTGDFHIADSLGYVNKVGGRIGVAIDNLNSDALPDLIMGNYRGGLSLYYGATGTPGGINENQSAFELNVYPNPVGTLLTISTNETRNYRYRITDISGKMVLSGNFKSSLCQVDLTSFSEGIYLLQLVDDRNYVKTQKLVCCKAK